MFKPQHHQIRCVLKPNLDVRNLNECEWNVYEVSPEGKPGRKFLVEFRDQKIICSCSEYDKYNICNHIIEVLKVEQDFNSMNLCKIYAKR